MKSRIHRLLVVLLLLAGTLFAAPARPVRAAATCTVGNTADKNFGSLRDCLATVDVGGTVIIPASITTITLTSFELTFSKTMTITGPNNGSTSVSGGNTLRVFHIASGVTVNISGLRIVSGKTIDADGAGIWNEGTLTLDHVTLASSQATVATGTASGGGIANYGTLTITNSTISSNRAGSMGAGIYNDHGRSLSMTNVSVVSNNLLGVNSKGAGLAIRGPNGISTPGAVTLDQLSITSNYVNTSGSVGGGIYSDGSFTITDSLIASNSADSGGGLRITDETGGTQPAAVAITNVTITQNAGYGGVGGAAFSFSQAGSAATLNNVTLASNTNDLATPAGGITTEGSGTIHMLNSILAGNIASASAVSSPRDCTGTIHSQDYNLIQTTTGCTLTGTTTHNIYNMSPQLPFLADNGGPTKTLALPISSPAVDAGGTACAAADQRGVARPQGSRCDMGAFELEYAFLIKTYLPLVVR